MRTARPWLLAASSGVALALALPGLGWVPLVFLFPGLLLEALHDVSRWRRALVLGWTAGTVHWLVATNWVVPVMHHYGGLPLPLAVLALLAMAVYLGFTWALVAVVCHAAAPRLRPWVLPLAWTALEAARQLPPYRFPWNPTAAVFAEWPAALGSLPVWGASGLGWAVTALGAAAWALLRPPTRRPGLALGVAAAVLPMVAALLAPPAVPSGAPLEVAALQPGTSLEAKWDPAQWQEDTARVWNLTREAAARGAKLVLWPESAVPYNLEGDSGYRASVTSLARELDITIVLNSVGRTASGGATNSAYVVNPKGVLPERYDKVRLVPFGEYVPLIGRLAFAKPLVREVGHFEPGTSLEPLTAVGTKVGMAICYEVVFADLVASEVRRGAGLLVTITNDGWYGFSWAPSQHFAQAVLRAAETRRWLARAALTGISGFIDPQGRVVARLPVGEHGVLEQMVQPTTGRTPRVRFGDWWAGLAAAAVVVLLAVGRRRRSETFDSSQPWN